MHVPNQRVIRPHTEWLASAELPTRHGVFKTHVFRTYDSVEEAESPTLASENPMGAEPLGAPSVPGLQALAGGEALPASWKEHVALVYGEVAGKEQVPVRVHSECITSEVFGSLKCDCRDQLEAAMAMAVHRGAGVVLYLRQEGRGIGLGNKIRAYGLQAKGIDTVDANRLLGLPDDARRYDMVPEMLRHLDVRTIRLMTNNPDKVNQLRDLGVTVVDRIPVLVEPNPHSAGYLETKRVRMAHHLPTRANGSGTAPQTFRETRVSAKSDAE